jgi:hypothetical protein
VTDPLELGSDVRRYFKRRANGGNPPIRPYFRKAVNRSPQKLAISAKFF